MKQKTKVKCVACGVSHRGRRYQRGIPSTPGSIFLDYADPICSDCYIKEGGDIKIWDTLQAVITQLRAS